MEGLCNRTKDWEISRTCSEDVFGVVLKNWLWILSSGSSWYLTLGHLQKRGKKKRKKRISWEKLGLGKTPPLWWGGGTLGDFVALVALFKIFVAVVSRFGGVGLGVHGVNSGKEERAQRLTFWVRRLPGGVGGALPRKGVVAEKFVRSLPWRFGFLGFGRWGLGCPGDLAWTPGGVRKVCAGRKKAHQHKYFWPVTPSVRGQSPGRVTRGQRFMYYPRNPRNINLVARVSDQEDRWQGWPDRVLRAKVLCAFSVPQSLCQRKVCAHFSAPVHWLLQVIRRP